MNKRLLGICIISVSILMYFGCVSTKQAKPQITIAPTAAPTVAPTEAPVKAPIIKAPTEPQAGVLALNDNEVGDGLNQFKYQPDWNYATGNDPKYQLDDHYSGGANAYYQVKFMGTNIKVYGTRDLHHGDAFASIDGGEEVKVTFKDNNRDYQVLIFDSGLLEKGEHTLKIRVAGNGVVTADRVDITE